MGDNPTRKGSTLICPSCGGNMYVPQVQQKMAATAPTAASATQPSGPRKAAPPIRPRTSKQSSVSSTGVGVTLVILAIVVIGGGGLSFAGYLVYKASRIRIDAQEQRKAEFMAADLEAQRLEKEKALTSPSLAIRREPTSQDLATLQRIYTALVEGDASTSQDYKEDMARAGLNRLLTAVRIAKDANFEESRKIITDLRQVMDTHQNESTYPFMQFVKQLEESEFQGISKEALVNEAHSRIPVVEEYVKQYWALERKIIDQYELAINHLEATRGTWKIEGESLVFEQPKDAERYKVFFAEVDKHTQSKLKLNAGDSQVAKDFEQFLKQ